MRSKAQKKFRLKHNRKPENVMFGVALRDIEENEPLMADDLIWCDRTAPYWSQIIKENTDADKKA